MSDAETARLFQGDVEIGSARTIAPFDLDIPARPSREAARAAAHSYLGTPLRECFVCGLDRAKGDALCLHTGAVEGADIVADVWTPTPDLADETGRLSAEFIWAALDCPSYFGLRRPNLLALLGRLSADIVERPKIGDDLIVIGWDMGADGRKFYGGSALCNAGGRVLAKAKAVWVELKAA